LKNNMREGARMELSRQKESWNRRAEEWDSDIKNPEHYANFEEGYKKFLDFERKHLENVESADAGMDLGCGTGETSVLLTEKVRKLYLVDIAKEMLKEARKKCPDGLPIQASAAELPLKKESIDILISRGIVVSHLPQEMTDNFFNEIARIVKKKGVVIFDFLTKNTSAKFKNISKNRFSKKQIEEELKRKGFEDIEFDGQSDGRVNAES